MIFRVFLRDVPAIAEHVRPGRTLRLTDPLPVRSRKAKEGRVRRTACQSLRSSSSVSTDRARFSAPPRARWTADRRGDLEIAGVNGEAQRGLRSTRHGSPIGALLGVAPQRVPHLDAAPGCAALSLQRRVERSM